MPPQISRQYRLSEKRKITREQNCAAIEAAAWRVFCDLGIDAANVRDIVHQSGVSAGTFYNYYGSKEAIFEVLSQQLFEQIREVTRLARDRATTLEESLFFAYKAYFDLIQSIDGAMDFVERNLHHLRSQLYASEAISGLLKDVEADLRRYITSDAMSDLNRGLASWLIMTAGAEAIFLASRKPMITTEAFHGFLTKFMMHGLSEWRTVASSASSADSHRQTETTRP